jgi:hypothetical protein
MSFSRQTCLRVALVLSVGSVGLAGSAGAQTALGYGPVVDFNADGYADIADHHTASGNFYVRLNNQNGTFQAPGVNWTSGTTSAPSGTWTIVLGNFNTISFYVDYLEIHRPSGQVWLHTGTATGFSPTGTLEPVTVSTSPNVEFLVKTRGPAPPFLFEHNRVTGSLLARDPNMFPLATSNFTTQTGSDWRVIMCDMDNNFSADVIEYHIPSAQFWVHLTSDSSGYNFNPTAAFMWTAFSHPSFTTVFGDYNNDGLCDYADVNRTTGDFWVHLNNGNGTFNAANYAQGLYTANAGFSIMGMPVSLP